MDRRDLLKSAAAAAALTLLPSDAHAAWMRVRTRNDFRGAGSRDESAGVFSAEQSALIAAMCDTIIPRTNTPGANDVNVIGFMSVIVGENYSDTDRTAFLTGLDSIDAFAKTTANGSFASLSESARKTVMDALEKPADRAVPAIRAYGRLKGMIVNGYFTSERVQKDVLHTVIMPGRFDGSAPFVPRTGASSHE